MEMTKNYAEYSAKMKWRKRALDNNMTKAERAFLQFCKDRNIFPSHQKILYRQHAILDFLFPADVGLEIDGSVHDGREEYDAKRTERISKRGKFKIVRATNEEAINNPVEVLRRVYETMRKNGCIFAPNIEKALNEQKQI